MKKNNKKIEKYHEVFTHVYFVLAIILFSLVFFYIDPSITGYSTFQSAVADTIDPNITVNFPLNYSNLSYTSITFNLTIGDDNANITNVSIFGNWTGTYALNSTNSSVALANNITYITINITQGRGNYLWAAKACDNSSNCNYSSNYTFFINRLPVVASINISNTHGANKTSGDLEARIAYHDADSDSQSLNETRWYNNSVEITAFKNFTLITNENTTAGDTWILSARVFDGDNWSLWYNSSSHSIQNNAAPNFTGTIPVQSWNEDNSLSNSINLSTYFTDDEGDTLAYRAIGVKSIKVTISTDTVSFTQPVDWNGNEYVVFIANDGNLTQNSNNVTLSVNPLAEPIAVVESGGGITRKQAAIGIISPTHKEVFLKDKVIIDIKLKNTGSEFLQGIKLSAISTEPKIKVSLDKLFFPTLGQNKEEDIKLEIETDLNQEKEAAEIIINAEVSNPQLKDATRIYLNAIEFGASNKSVIIPRMEYARDLFAENNQCSQLNVLIEKAETLFREEHFNEAQNLIDQAINGCNDIVLLDPKKLEITKKSKFTQNLILFGEVFVFMFLMIVFLVYYRKRRSDYIRGL
ncbi:MAG: hypothetical protein AABW58_02085 [Nanoarchaeota archaeon]